MSLRTLDIGLLQAGASMKGEFENRLRQVIEEVQASPKPIILFIDEAHTLIGAGGAAGTGDAANLLKPALARGKLRTIAATTWAEYKKHIEKDPALTRRFQVVQVDEPSEEKAILMMRGMASTLEKHHRVQVLDEALEAAVQAVASLHPGPAAARQIGQPARHGVRARRRQPARDAGRGRRLPAAHRGAARPSWRSSAARTRSASTSTRRDKDATRSSPTEKTRLAELDEALAGRRRSWSIAILDMRAKLRGAAGTVEGTEQQAGGSGRQGGCGDSAAGSQRRRAAATRRRRARPRRRCSPSSTKLQGELDELQGEAPLILPTRR